MLLKADVFRYIEYIMGQFETQWQNSGFRSLAMAMLFKLRHPLRG